MMNARQLFNERRVCRCSMCAAIPERAGGRVWYAIVERDPEGRIADHKVFAHEAGLDGATFLNDFTFEPDEWESLERV
jgi:hypothetical protein